MDWIKEMKIKTYRVTIFNKKKKIDSYIISGESKKSIYNTLKEFYYRTKKIKSKKDFDCHLVRVEFDGNNYIEVK